jgi:hypothetical protein
MAPRTSLLAWLAASAAAAGITVAAPVAEACGGFFCQNVPVDQTGEHILFAVDGDSVEAQVLIQYQGAAEDFSWVVPVPSEPEVDVSSPTVFARLTQLTGIRFQLNWDFENGCYPPVAEDGGSPSAGGGDPDAGVTVVQQSVVGPYNYAVLRATDVGALFEWLGANDYTIPDTAESLLEPYVLMGDQMHFVAFKLQKDRDIGDIRPVVLRYRDDQPMIPIQLTAIATQPNLGVTANILGPVRSVPENYLHVEINEARINWLSGGSNYDALINDAMDEAGGQAFTTEFAGSSSALQGAFFVEGTLDTSRLATIDDPILFFAALQEEGFSGDPQLLSLLQEFIPMPAELEASGLQPRDFYNNLSAYESYLSTLEFDAPAFANKLEADIVAPLRHAQELFDRLPYFTRLHTSLSASEMTVDPVFAFNGGLGDVSNIRTATAVMECTPGSWDLNAPVVITLSDGREVLTSYGGGGGELDALPGALSISEMGASGAPVPVGRTDGRSPAAELAAYNDAAAASYPDTTFDLNAGTDPAVPPTPGTTDRPPADRISSEGCSSAPAGTMSLLSTLVAMLPLLRRRRRTA